jgi:single-strand DNA-binding protein
MVIDLSGFAFAEVQGRLTRDPELNETNSGKQVVNFSLAVNRRFNKNDEVDYFDITAWGELAKNVAAYKNQGDLVYVRGSLQNDKWEKDGQKRVKTKLVANDVVFVSNKGDGSPSTNGQSETASEKSEEFADIPF